MMLSSAPLKCHSTHVCTPLWLSVTNYLNGSELGNAPVKQLIAVTRLRSIMKRIADKREVNKKICCYEQNCKRAYTSNNHII